MRNLKLSRWVAVVTLALALAPGAASAQETNTLSITGTYHMDELSGTVGADFAEVFARDNDHSWSLTLSGVSSSYDYAYDDVNDIEYFITRVHATSIDFEFFGPDANVLNAVISQQLTGSSLGDDVFLELRNIYSYGGIYPGGATWDLGLLPFDESTGVSFSAGAWFNYLTGVWFPTDESDSGYPGYPTVEPQRITSRQTSLHDSRPGNSGSLVSINDVVDIGSSEPPVLPPTLSIADGSVLEGDKWTTLLNLTVTLTKVSSGTVTVKYATSNGTALAKQDYTATSGTLTFQSGQTSRVVSIAIKTDRKREPNETFTVQLSNPAGATIAEGVATATILNDD